MCFGQYAAVSLPCTAPVQAECCFSTQSREQFDISDSKAEGTSLKPRLQCAPACPLGNKASPSWKTPTDSVGSNAMQVGMASPGSEKYVT